MKTKQRKRIVYTDEPLDLRVIPDFLPPPDQLVRRDDTVKVTMSLSKSSVEFFKRIARRQHAPYQAMIRKVLDLYSAHYH